MSWAVQAMLEDDEAQLTAGLLVHEAPAGDPAAGEAPILPRRVPRSSIEGRMLKAYSSRTLEVLHEVVQPTAILLLGVGFSIAALWVALSAFMPASQDGD